MRDEEDRPQPRKDRNAGQGMQVSVGAHPPLPAAGCAHGLGGAQLHCAAQPVVLS